MILWVLKIEPGTPSKNIVIRILRLAEKDAARKQASSAFQQGSAVPVFIAWVTTFSSPASSYSTRIVDLANHSLERSESSSLSSFFPYFSTSFSIHSKASSRYPPENKA